MKSIRLSVATATAIISLSVLGIGSVAADQAALVPLDISPVCVVAATNQAYWTVNNKNTGDVIVNWDAIDNATTGSYDAPAGVTQFATYYDATDPNNTTTFSNTAIDMSQPSGTQTDTVSRNSSNTACQPGQVTVAVATNPIAGGTTTVPTPTIAVTTPASTGGLGGGTSSATTTSPAVVATPAVSTAAATATVPELAYTGASRLMPYTAAAIIALFTVATTVLVRKNIL